MKNIFIFLLILTTCGSLTKPTVVLQECGTKVQALHYLKGKLIHTDIEYKFCETQNSFVNTICSLHGNKISFHADSVAFGVYMKPIKK